MAIYEHMKKFAGLPIRDWVAPADDAEAYDEDDQLRPPPPLKNPAKTLFRISMDYDELDGGETWEGKFQRFLQAKGADRALGIVAGNFGMGSETPATAVTRPLAKAAKRLPAVRAIFVGDITMEENEISWIEQANVGPLLKAFPLLEHFGVRGGNGLSFQTPGHANLRTLVIETGGLRRKVFHQVLQADWPQLEHLEIWLGDPNYGADTTVEDIAALLSGTRFPKLKHLGLRNAEFADDIAAVIVNAPVLQRLETLDLSLGMLSDAGADALLAAPKKAFKRLQRLDLHHNYCTPAILKRLRKLGPKVDVSDGQGDVDVEDRFVAVGE